MTSEDYKPSNIQVTRDKEDKVKNGNWFVIFDSKFGRSSQSLSLVINSSLSFGLRWFCLELEKASNNWCCLWPRRSQSFPQLKFTFRRQPSCRKLR